VARFIKLTSTERAGRQVIVNLDLIATLDPESTSDGRFICTWLHFNRGSHGPGSTAVKESPDCIMELIAEEIARNPLNR